MKKFLSVILLALMAVQVSYAADVVTQETEKLPVEARNFISQYFPQAKVSRVKVDDGILMSTKYEVLFSNGMEIDFDSKGNWTEIDMKREKMPVNVLPSSVNDYVKRTYGSNFVTKIEHDGDGYDVKLDNGLSLKFDQTGAFKKIDD